MATDGAADRSHESAPTIAARGPGQQAGGSGGGDLTQELLTSGWWTDALVAAAGIPVVDVPFVTVGGRIGSFVTVDYLRIAGVPVDRMRVLSDIDFPWQTYEYLTRVSQIQIVHLFRTYVSGPHGPNPRQRQRRRLPDPVHPRLAGGLAGG